MANKTVRQLPILIIPSTGDINYVINGAQSYQVPLDTVARLLLTEYNILADPINPLVMTSGNAQVILNGLNNAYSAKLSADRIDLDLSNFISGYFDVDGGTLYDTYTNTSTFDGGPITV